MTTTPTIHILTPCYDAGDSIDETIHSVVSQAGKFHIRYHVQDGGSQDGTTDRLQAWENKLADGSFPLLCEGITFTWRSEKDKGMYDAINKGFAAMDIAEDGIMAWVNSDDTYTQHAFATAMEVFRQNSTVRWIGGMIVLLDDKGCLHPTDQLDYYPQELIRQGCCDGPLWPHMQQNGMFWRHSLWTDAEALDEQLSHAGDWDLWQRFARLADFVHIRVVFGTFRVHSGQLSQDKHYEEEQESRVPLAEREKRARNFFSKFMTAPSVLIIEPESPWRPGKRMKVAREINWRKIKMFQKQRFRLWKSLLPDNVRSYAGRIRRFLQSAFRFPKP